MGIAKLPEKSRKMLDLKRKRPRLKLREPPKKRERKLKKIEKLTRSKKRPLFFQQCCRDTTKKPPESVEERSDVSSDDLLPSNKHKLKLLAFKSPYSENPPCTTFMPF